MKPLAKHTRWHRFLGFALGATLVSTLFARPIEVPTPPQTGDFRVIIPLYGEEQFTLAARYLRPGDMVVVYPPRPELEASGQPQDPAHWIERAERFKAEFPKVETIFNFDGIDQMREWTPKLPAAVDWVSYDYERWQTTPEYSAQQSEVLRYFEEARRIAHDGGKRLFLTPVPFFNADAIAWARQKGYMPAEIAPWDFGELARTSQGFNAQFQFLLKDAVWLEKAVHDLVVQRDARAPKTLFFVQIGPGVDGRLYTQEELRSAIRAIRQGGADGVVIWFGPRMANWARQSVEMLQEALGR